MYRLPVTCLLLCAFGILTIDAAAAFRNTKVGIVSHDFSLESVEGKPLRLSDARGERATVVVFWATWNPRSRDALSDMQKLHTRFGEKGLAVLSVNVDGEGYGDDRRTAVVTTIDDLGLSYPVLVDEDLEVYEAYGVMAVPSIVLIGPKGTVAEVMNGYASSGRDQFRRRVLTALEVIAPESEEKSAGTGSPDPRDKVERYLQMGRLFQNKGRPHDAIRYFTLAVADDPSDREACQTLATALQRVGRLDEAARVLAQSISLALR